MISLSDVRKAYAGSAVLDGVSVTIEAGSFVALVGQSGAGKSTLLKAVNRLTEVDGGTVRVFGRDTRDFALPELRRRIGYVFQQVGLFPHLPVAENIWMGPRLRGDPATQREDRVAELLDLVSLPGEFAARLPHQLSGGQAQRVGFARALAAQPAIMLMDEPFGALDPVTRSALGATYRALHDRLGLTSVLVTHDLTEALMLADRIVVVSAGRIVVDRDPGELVGAASDPRVSAMLDVLHGQIERLDRLVGRP